MLIYDNRERLRILLQIEGSVLWRTLALGVVVGAATFGFAWWIRFENESFWKPHITDTWAANVVGTAISFAIVYRTSMAWARYWEAANQVQFMFSKWSDSFSQLMSFISTAEKKLEKLAEKTRETEERRHNLRKARRRLAHDFTLLSAMGTHRLTHGDLGRMRRRSEKYSEGVTWGNWCCCLCRLRRHWGDLIVYKQDLRYNDVTNAFRMPLFKIIELQSRHTLVRARIQKQTTGHTGVNKTYSHVSEASHKSRIFKSVTSINAGDSPHSVGEATDERRVSTGSGESVILASNVTWSSDLVILGPLTNEERSELDCGYNPDDKTCTQPDRVNLLNGWITEDINELVPLCEIPPPIMSRCYQELSNGMLGFNQATKMADIPFPFPFSQLLELLLVCFTFLIPVYAANFTGGVFSSPFLAGVVTVAFWSLSEISRELETPFADGPNQLPVIDMHERFVEVVRSMYLTRRPTPSRQSARDPSEILMDDDSENLVEKDPPHNPELAAETALPCQDKPPEEMRPTELRKVAMNETKVSFEARC